MIYLQNSHAPQVVRFPNNGLVAGADNGKLHLVSSVGRKEVWTDTEYLYDPASKLTYQATLRLPSGLRNGEYSYELRDNASGKMLSCGMLQIGEYESAKPVQEVGTTFEIKQAK